MFCALLSTYFLILNYSKNILEYYFKANWQKKLIFLNGKRDNCKEKNSYILQQNYTVLVTCTGFREKKTQEEKHGVQIV